MTEIATNPPLDLESSLALVEMIEPAGTIDVEAGITLRASLYRMALMIDDKERVPIEDILQAYKDIEVIKEWREHE